MMKKLNKKARNHIWKDGKHCFLTVSGKKGEKSTWSMDYDERTTAHLAEHIQKNGAFTVAGRGKKGEIKKVVFAGYYPYKDFPGSVKTKNGNPFDLSSGNLYVTGDLVPANMQRRIWHDGYRIFIKRSCADDLYYIANGITQRGIPVMRVEIISNGLVYDERLVAVMKRFGEITRLTAEQGYNKSHWGPWCALLGISLDRHHESGKVCAANYKRYKEVLAGHAEVLRISHGNDYIRAGRAVDLPGGQDISFFTSSYMAQRVEVLDFEHKPMCKFYQSYHLARADQKVICCALYVTALGDVSPTWACNAEYDSWEVRLCHTWESVWDAILRYNDEYNLHPCTYCEDLRIKYVFMDAVLNNGGKLANKPILDEQSAETFDEDEERRLQQLYEASCQEPDMSEEIERRARERNYLTVKGVQLQ